MEGRGWGEHGLSGKKTLQEVGFEPQAVLQPPCSCAASSLTRGETEAGGCRWHPPRGGRCSPYVCPAPEPFLAAPLLSVRGWTLAPSPSLMCRASNETPHFSLPRCCRAASSPLLDVSDLASELSASGRTLAGPDPYHRTGFSLLVVSHHGKGLLCKAFCIFIATFKGRPGADKPTLPSG